MILYYLLTLWSFFADQLIINLKNSNKQTKCSFNIYRKYGNSLLKLWNVNEEN